MELWTVVPAVWITTWVMCVYRTYPLIRQLILNEAGAELIVSYKYIHMIIYGVMVFIMTPFAWKIAFSDDLRARWCIAYVIAICRSKK
jgi:hypothetical protein